MSSSNRRFPGLRRYPHFSRESLSVSLPKAGIEYVHLVELGGRRDPLPDSPNTAWRNDQFRGYADHMATSEFQNALDRLLTSDVPTAIMCAEAVPWRCHRSLVADALGVRGVPVIEILSESSCRMHQLTPFAQVEGVRITYPPQQAALL